MPTFFKFPTTKRFLTCTQALWVFHPCPIRLNIRSTTPQSGAMGVYPFFFLFVKIQQSLTWYELGLLASEENTRTSYLLHPQNYFCFMHVSFYFRFSILPVPWRRQEHIFSTTLVISQYLVIWSLIQIMVLLIFWLAIKWVFVESESVRMFMGAHVSTVI